MLALVVLLTTGCRPVGIGIAAGGAAGTVIGTVAADEPILGLAFGATAGLFAGLVYWLKTRPDRPSDPSGDPCYSLFGCSGDD